MVHRNQLPALVYDRNYIENHEKKKSITLFIYPATHQLINTFRSTFGFSTTDDALVDAILSYKKPVGFSQYPTYTSYSETDDPAIAIAGDESRRMNRKKRKKGKSLMPERSQAFTNEALFEDGS